MKRFIFSVLAIAVFCVGLGTIVERAGAGSKSDEKALAIIRDARQAIGGDTAIAAVRSLIIGGNVTHTLKIDGVERTVQGESEIALQLPDRVMRTIAIKHDDGTPGDKMVHKQVDVEVVGDKGIGEGHGVGTGVKHIVLQKGDGTVQELSGAEAEKVVAADGGASGDNVRKVIIKKPDGTTEEFTGDAADKMIRKTEGDKAMVRTEIEKGQMTNGNQIMLKRVGGPEHEGMRQNELLRLTLGLLLTAPQGMDVSYTYGGEADVDGTACNIVVAEFGGAAYKLFIGKSSNLPVMMKFKGMPMPQVMTFRTKAPEGSEPKDNVIFTRKVDAPPSELVDVTVKFSDYRSTGGLQLPYKWVQSGEAGSETFEVANYDVNPANIADKFNNNNVRIKVEKPNEN